jgi:hypothetical protein
MWFSERSHSSFTIYPNSLLKKQEYVHLITKCTAPANKEHNTRSRGSRQSCREFSQSGEYKGILRRPRSYQCFLAFPIVLRTIIVPSTSTGELRYSPRGFGGRTMKSIVRYTNDAALKSKLVSLFFNDPIELSNPAIDKSRGTTKFCRAR